MFIKYCCHCSTFNNRWIDNWITCCKFWIFFSAWSNGGPLTTTTPSTTTEPIPDEISVTETNEGKYYEPGELIFEDNFDTLNTFVWQNEITLAGGGNWEFQFYTHNRTNRYAYSSQLFFD